MTWLEPPPRGFRLVYNDTRNEYLKDLEEGGPDKLTDASFSIGIRVKEHGELDDVILGTPAYAAGIVPGMNLVAVNGRRFSPDVLRDVLEATSAAPATLTLLVESEELFTQHSFPYQGGLREPHLERDDAKPDLLDQLLAPLAPNASH